MSFKTESILDNEYLVVNERGWVPVNNNLQERLYSRSIRGEVHSCHAWPQSYYHKNGGGRGAFVFPRGTEKLIHCKGLETDHVRREVDQVWLVPGQTGARLQPRPQSQG